MKIKIAVMASVMTIWVTYMITYLFRVEWPPEFLWGVPGALWLAIMTRKNNENGNGR